MNVIDYFKLNNRLAVVTGGSKGLGRGYAKTLSAAGATTIMLARNEKALIKVQREIEDEGGRAEGFTVDITDNSSVRNTINTIIEKYGKIDILINNAGLEIPKPFTDIEESDFDAIMGTNLKGLFFVTQAVTKQMIKQKSGKIINAGSLASHIGIAKATVYSASKGGVLQFTKALALELAEYNIQVNAIGPGYFHTDMTDPFFKDPNHRKWIEERIPAGRIGTDSDLSAAILFLSSPGSDYITGQIIYVDGGWLAG